MELRIITLMFRSLLVVIFVGTFVLAAGTDSLAENDHGAWFRASVPPVEEFLTEALRLPDGRVVVSVRTSPLIYDPRTGEWQVGAQHGHVEELMEGITIGWRPSRGTVLQDGRVLAVGGTFSRGISPGSTGATNLVAIYDPGTDEWTDVAPMNQSRVDPSVSILQDGSVLVAGGGHGGGVQIGSAGYVRETAERYYPEENRWELVGDMHVARSGHSALDLPDGRVLVIGGQDAPPERPEIAEIFDPATNSWEIIASNLPEELLGHAAELLDDAQVLIAGGATVNPLGGPEEPHASAWILDAETGDLQEIASMSEPRSRHSATRLPSGKVLVAGGFNTIGFEAARLASVEVFDPTTGEWSVVAPMNEGRAGHRTVALDDRAQGASVYVIGGTEDRYSPDAPEVFYEAAPGHSDRQPPPAEPHPSHRYFPQTSHYLSFGFKDFWDQSGGLPVFGYPLSTEFDEYNPELDDMRTSQYFERQRFEYHPEHAGTPYEVQLGRLGFADAQRRGLLDTEAFRPVDEAEIMDGCRYFPETEQSVCGAFLSYWHEHGLNFGDPGVCFRESLALFGFPISEEFVDPETGLRTQYFERVKFEHHPDNPEEHRVLLGRLGADLLRERER